MKLPTGLEHRFEAECVDTTLRLVRNLCLPLAALFAAFGLVNALRLPRPAAIYLPLHDVFLVLCFVSLRTVGARLLTPHRAVGLLAVVTPLLVLSNTMVSAWFDATPMPSLYAALVLVGIGGTFLVVWWAAAAMAACALTWGLLLPHISRDRQELGEHVVVLLTAIGLGAVFNYAARNAARRITQLRSSDADRQRLLEEALAIAESSRHELDIKVAARTVELAAARDAIAAELADRKTAEERRQLLERRLADAQRMEAVGRLAGGVAHDFNNLLMIIGSNVELLLENDRVETAEKADLSEIQEAVKRSSKLIRQLLASGQRQVMQPRRTTLVELITAVRPMIERVVGADIALVIEPADGELAITVDRGQLEQVILNLVLNARDAMPRGGTLTIRCRKTSVDDPASSGHADANPGTYAVLEVADTGHGMDESVRRSVFEPFFTTKSAGNGSGLGLAAVNGIVSQHGGFVDVTSSPGTGSVFAIYLPSDPNPSGRAASDSEATHVERPGHETVLVVEDEPALRRLAINGLTRLGYHVLSASDADAALRVMATTAPIDLMVTDVIMPGIDGVELADRVRARWPNTRILYMSGFVGDRLAARGLGDDDEQLLQKPFSLRELADRVRRVLDKPTT